jgi:hypothetical protein
LATRTTIPWGPTGPAPECGNGTYGGDWGDPFAASAQMNADLLSKKVTPSGTETVNDLSAKVLDADMGADGEAKVWLKPRYYLLQFRGACSINARDQFEFRDHFATILRPFRDHFATMGLHFLLTSITLVRRNSVNLLFSFPRQASYAANCLGFDTDV